MISTRRRFLALSGGVVAGAALLGASGCASTTGQTGQVLRSRAPLPPAFAVPLPVPPVARQVAPDTYDIVARAATADIIPGRPTTIWGYDGLFPGPTVESRRGRPVVVRHRNQLPVPTVVHLHGGHTPAEHDGWPTDLVLPEGVADWPVGHMSMGGDIRRGVHEHVYPMNQRASTLWYHDHRMDFTGPQVWRGLAGFHLVRDDEEDALGLPSGPRELPLMITDRTFDVDGSMPYPSRDPALISEAGVTDDWIEGVLGDVVLVNGAPWPVAEVDAAQYRLRVLNASNARRYRLALGIPFVRIGSDGGLLEHPQPTNTLELAPAERADVIIDLRGAPAGSELTMVNEIGEGATEQVMRFRVVRAGVRDDARVPDRLSTIERLDPAAATVRREWRFARGPVHGHAGWTINSLPFDPARVDATPRLGEVELWRFASDLHHPVHVHLDPFQVITRGGVAPLPGDAGWKDTIDLRPAEDVEVAVRFTEHLGDYLIHCHNLEHEDMAMMATFATI